MDERHGAAPKRRVRLSSSAAPDKTDDNPDGSLSKELAASMTTDPSNDEAAFCDEFVTQFLSVNDDGELKVTDSQRQDALALCTQADKNAALACMESFGTTDFREDLLNVSLPALILRGDIDGICPSAPAGALTRPWLAVSST